MRKIRRSGVDVSVDYAKAAGLYAAIAPDLVRYALKPGDDAAREARREISGLLADVLGGEAPDERRVEAALRMGCAVMRAVRDVRREWGRDPLTDRPTGEGGLQLRHSVALLEALHAAAEGVCAMIALGPEASPNVAFASVMDFMGGKAARALAAMDGSEVECVKADVLNRIAHSVLSAPIPVKAPDGMARLRWIQRYGHLSMAAEGFRAGHLAALVNGGDSPGPAEITAGDEMDGAPLALAATDMALGVSRDAEPLLDLLVRALVKPDHGCLLPELSMAGWPDAPTGNLRSRMEAVVHATGLALADVNVDGKQGAFVSLLPNPTRMLAWGCVEILAGIGFPPEPAGATSAAASRNNPKPYVYGNLVTRMSDAVSGITSADAEEVDLKIKGVRKDEGGAASREYSSGRVRPGGLALAFGYRWRSPSGEEERPADPKPSATVETAWSKVWAGKDWGGKR